MKLGWLTDIHLCFINTEKAIEIMRNFISEHSLDGLIISGDIECVEDLILLNVPIFFVLGNHDFYGSDIESRREKMNVPTYLTKSNPIFIKERTVLTGEDGWYDMRAGNWKHTTVRLNDFFQIKDFDPWQWDDIILRCRILVVEAVNRLKLKIDSILEKADEIYIVTHVPPFIDASWHSGKISSNDYLPFFTSISMGEYLLNLARDHEEKKFVVLCGHTHGSGVYNAAKNLIVYTGKANYGEIFLSGVIE